MDKLTISNLVKYMHFTTKVLNHNQLMMAVRPEVNYVFEDQIDLVYKNDDRILLIVILPNEVSYTCFVGNSTPYYEGAITWHYEGSEKIRLLDQWLKDGFVFRDRDSYDL